MVRTRTQAASDPKNLIVAMETLPLARRLMPCGINRIVGRMSGSCQALRHFPLTSSAYPVVWLHISDLLIRPGVTRESADVRRARRRPFSRAPGPSRLGLSRQVCGPIVFGLRTDSGLFFKKSMQNFTTKSLISSVLRLAADCGSARSSKRLRGGFNCKI